MPKASAITANKVSFLFKGPFGFGKTLAAASFALEGPVYLSYWDKKSPLELISFFTEKRFGAKAKKILDNIEFDIYSAMNAHEYLNKLVRFQDDCRFVATINDSLTFMTSSCANWSLNFGKNSKERKGLKDIIPDFDEYKAETSLVTQCIELSRNLPCHNIWTAHPLPTTKIEGSGSSMRVTKVNSLVTYGSKVAGMVPGGFTEIYHFAQETKWDQTGAHKKYIVHTDAVGDEFAKSPLIMDGLGLREFDITDKLFYEVWKDLVMPKNADASKTQEQTK